MKKRFTVYCVLLAVLIGIVGLPYGVAEEFEPLRVYVHDALTMKYEVVGGSGLYEVVSTSLTDWSGAAVSPSEFEDGCIYFGKVTVRDLVTGETAYDSHSSVYYEPSYRSCERGDHYVETSESVGESPNYLVGTYYYDITETTHTILQKIAWHCDHCHAYVYTQELVNTREHYFDRSTGLCECGVQGALACLHNNTSSREGSVLHIMIDDNAEQHKHEQTYETYCVDCGEVISTSSETELENHAFSDRGYCACGYYQAPECRHTRTEKTYVDVSYTPSETDPGIHWVVPNYKLTCLDCGHVIDGVEDGSPDHHEFDEDGKCVCGYKIEAQGCFHENIDLQYVDTTYSNLLNNPETHWVQDNYNRYCLDCERVIDTVWEGRDEAHKFDDSDCCNICGYRISEEPETMQVSLAIWQKTATINSSIGVTANVSGGSGDFSYQWAATSVQGKRAQNNSTKNAWAITPTTPDTWYFSVTVCDNVTGETASAYSAKIVVSIDENRYRLSLPSNEYCIGDMRLVNTGTLIQTQILDTADGAIHGINDIPGISLHFSTDSSENTLTDPDLVMIKEGSVELKLVYYGTEVDSARFFIPYLSVEEWGLSEGNRVGTNVLRLEDIQLVDWDATGMLLSNDLRMFDFEANLTGAGGYIVKFDIHNSCPSTYAVASYYSDGTLCDKQFINSYWSDFWLGDILIGGGQAIAEGFDRKWGNSGLHTQKTTIELVVPEGGYYTFLEAHEDEDVMCRNIAELALGAIGTVQDALSLISVAEADQLESIRKELRSNDEVGMAFRTAFAKALKENLIKTSAPSSKEIVGIFKDTDKFLYNLLTNEDVVDALRKSLDSIGFSVVAKGAGKIATSLISPWASVITEGTDTLLNTVYIKHQVTHLQENANGQSQIPFDYIVMPSY